MDREELRKKLSKMSASDLVILRWHKKRREAQTCPEPVPKVWWLLGGRGAGKTYTASNHIFDFAANLPFTEENEIVYVGLIGSIFDDVKNTLIEGKALALDTLVSTPGGMVRMGDLEDGDTVLGGDGNPCNVVKAWGVRFDRPCYEVTFTGGVKVLADADHNWLTETFNARVARSEGRKRTKYVPSVVTTEEIFNSLKYREQSNHAVRTSFVPGPDVEPTLPLDPYVLGAWLGDGRSRCGEMTTADPEMLDDFAAAGFEPKHQPSSKYHYGIRGLTTVLREMGLLNNKHVPEAYFHGSYKQRLSLLQGLMDTDGFVSERGQCEFSNNNVDLIRAVVRLAGSLGIKAGAPKQKTEVAWLVKFTTTLPVFRLVRKLDRIPNSYRDSDYWHIVDVKAVPSVPVRCITVDSPDHTYMITDHHINTHNSGLLKLIPEEDLLKWNRTVGELAWQVIGPNGEVRQVQCLAYTSEKPDKLRGPNLHLAWIDEYAKFKDADVDPTKAGTTWNNMVLALRNGSRPHVIVTGTPTDCRLSKYLLEHTGMKMSLMTTHDNRDNLPESFYEELTRLDPNSAAYRQEVLAELIFDNPDALFKTETIETYRAPVPEEAEIVYKVLGYDPSVSSSADADECGLILCAYTPETKERSRDQGGRPRIVKPTHAYVLKDLSGHYTPHEQTQLVIQTMLNEQVNDLVFEQNQGVEFVMTQLEQALKDNVLEYYVRKQAKAKKTDYGIVKRWAVNGVNQDGMPFKFMIYAVHATSNKKLRAEMVSTRYGSGQIHHPKIETPLPVCQVGNCKTSLENQMTSWDPKNSRYSPDRLDAMGYCMLHIFANFMITRSKVTIARPVAINQGDSQHQAVKTTRRKGLVGVYSMDFAPGSVADRADRAMIPLLDGERHRLNPYL